jgi:cell division septation protein DedD
MKEKSKLLVFDKLEVLFIFIFMILTAVISFTLGIRLGKEMTFVNQGLTPEDKQVVEKNVGDDLLDLKSKEEEELQPTLNDSEAILKDSPEAREQQKVLSQQKLAEEFNNLEKKIEENLETPIDPINSNDSDETNRTNQPADKIQNADQNSKGPENKNFDQLREKYVGKYTIQLGSFNTLEEAKNFADGIKAIGYNPIINEVDLDQKGVWFRVSLGAYETATEARDYIKKEKSLFQGQDYVIVNIN